MRIIQSYFYWCLTVCIGCCEMLLISLLNFLIYELMIALNVSQSSIEHSLTSCVIWDNPCKCVRPCMSKESSLIVIIEFRCILNTNIYIMSIVVWVTRRYHMLGSPKPIAWLIISFYALASMELVWCNVLIQTSPLPA